MEEIYPRPCPRPLPIFLPILLLIFLFAGNSLWNWQPIPVAHAKSANLLQNPGFESGKDNWYDFGGAAQITLSTAHSGAISLQMGTGQQGAVQNITLQPNTIYTLGGWGKTSGSGEYSQITLSVIDGSNRTYQYQMAFSSTHWVRQVRTIKTPATISSALVYILKNAGSGYFYADDIFVSQGRDPEAWPFSQDSIWNMPIGDGAARVDAGIGAADNAQVDFDYFNSPDTSGPYGHYTLYSPDGPQTGNNIGRCNGTSNYGPIQFPQDLVIPDGTLNPFSTPNNASASLQADGRTLLQLQPTARCTANDDVHGYRGPDQDIYDKGLYGGHSGSGLNSIGGMIRHGELTDATPIMHTLQLEIWAAKYLYYSSSDATPGFRWPAATVDSYANRASGGYCTLDPCKSHPNKQLVLGSLLALPTDLTEDSLGLTTLAGKKLFHALQDYGGYLVDDTYWDNNGIGVDINARSDINFDDGTYKADVNALFQKLQIITNNSPTSIGGGNPRAPLAPDFVAPPPPAPVALHRTGWTATASLNSGDANLMLDGNDSTGWRSGQPLAGGQYIQIDMRTPRIFTKIAMNSDPYPVDHPQDYDVFVSNDGVHWCKVIHGSGSRSSIISFPVQYARYIKVQSSGGGLPSLPKQTWSVAELNVYNTPNSN